MRQPRTPIVFWIAGCVIAVGVLVVLPLVWQWNTACTSAGGTPVRSFPGLVCLKSEAVIKAP